MKNTKEITTRIFLYNETGSVYILIFVTFVLHIYENVLYDYFDLLFVLTTIIFFQLVQDFTSELDKSLAMDAVSILTYIC